MKIVPQNKIALLQFLDKARTEMTYIDNSLNRKLGRVGKPYKKNVSNLPEGEERNKYRYIYEDTEKNRKLERVGLSPYEYKQKQREKKGLKDKKKFDSIKSEKLKINWNDYSSLPSFVKSLSEEEKLFLQDKLLVATEKFKIPKNIISVDYDDNDNIKLIFRRSLINNKLNNKQKSELKENIRKFLRQQRNNK